MSDFLTKLSALPEVKRASDEQAAETSKFDDMMSKGWPLNLKLSGEYDGPTLPEELTLESVLALLQHYHRAELQGEFSECGRRLHHKFVYQILAACLAKTKTRPTVVHVSTVVSQNITVIGDLHGARRNRRARARARPASSPR